MIGQHIGSYKIVRVLGEGGMGEVFEAVHEKLHRRAAIKVLHPHVARAPEMAARFRNEARAVNIIHHPGVVDIYEHGQLPDGTVYLVMEYLEGRSLREVLEHDVLTEAQAILLSQQLASALAAAHGKGIIHRGQMQRFFRQRKCGVRPSRKNFGSKKSENQPAPHGLRHFAERKKQKSYAHIFAESYFAFFPGLVAPRLSALVFALLLGGLGVEVAQPLVPSAGVDRAGEQLTLGGGEHGAGQPVLLREQRLGDIGRRLADRARPAPGGGAPLAMQRLA